MFPGQLIAAAFVGIFVAIFALQFAETRRWLTISKVLPVVGLVASVYCVAAGLSLIAGWHDPLAKTSAEQIGHAAATSRGKGGLVLIAIRFWPYVLIGLGGFCAYSYAVIARRIFKMD